jgi:Domain of unknown function (DUF4386)
MKFLSVKMLLPIFHLSKGKVYAQQMLLKKSNKNPFITGILYIIAAVASIAGLALYDPVLNNPAYIIGSRLSNTQIYWGAFLEIITAFSVIGITISLFPILKKINLTLSVGHICFRLLEATIIIFGILCMISIVSLNQEYLKVVNPNKENYLSASKLLIAIKNWSFLFGPNLALAPSTFITGYLLYKSNLVPKIISILGMVGGLLIFLSGIFVLFDLYKQISVWGIVCAIPVFVFEMSLAIWLITKGFKVSQQQ